jgi:hypothetical protein
MMLAATIPTGESDKGPEKISFEQLTGLLS